ncbi:MAG: hypothetical protein NVSMB47_11560 [Polyangiales bacterium]
MRGNFYGSGIAGAIETFVARYGNAASAEVVGRLQTTPWKALVAPNAPRMGILGARLYPYPFVGALFRAMIAVARPPDEDAFIREIVAGGMDATLSTVNRALLRWMVTPAAHAKRAQEVWSHYHDAGTIKVVVSRAGEYVTEVHDWPQHDVMVCKVCLEARRRVLEKTGVGPIEATRTQCVAWGHPICAYRFVWKVPS